MIHESRTRKLITRKVKGIDIIHLPQSYYHPDLNLTEKKIKIVHTMSNVARNPVGSELEGANRGFTPVNPGGKMQISPKMPVPSSKSKAKAESSVKVTQPDKTKAKAKGVMDAMHDSKVKKESSVKAIQPVNIKAKNKDATKVLPAVKAKSETKPTPSVKAKAKAKTNPFILGEAKAPSKSKAKPKVKSASPQSDNDSESEDPAPNGDEPSDLQMKDITNRNKTTVSRLVEALSTRGLATKGNRADVTARFILYELDLDKTGSDKEMHAYCKELLQASMTRLKEILLELKQSCVGTNKPVLIGRILETTYQAEEDSNDEDGEESSSEEEVESDQDGPKKLATPSTSTSPDNLKNGKKRARAVDQDSDDEDVKPKRQKAVGFDDENDDPSCGQPTVKNPAILVDKKKRRRSDEKAVDNTVQKKHGKSVFRDPEEQQTKKVKLTEPKSKPKDRTSAAEVGRAVRAKPNPSTTKPKSKKKSKDNDNHFTFNSVLDSRTLFENVPVPPNVLDSALRVLTGLGTFKDINVVHDFRHPAPLFKLYREGKYRPNAKKCPKTFLAAQEFYQEREEGLALTIRTAEIKEDEEKAKVIVKEKEKDDQEMSEETTAEDDDEEEFDEDKDEQPDQEMTDDDDDDDDDIDDLIMAESCAANSSDDLAKVYQQAEISTYYEEVQKEQDEADDLRGKSLHASEISYLASIPEGTTLDAYYANLWDPSADDEFSKEQKMNLRKEEITLMKIAKVEVGSEKFRRVRWSHDGKW